jgi:CheY-like chemotaxis protein
VQSIVELAVAECLFDEAFRATDRETAFQVVTDGEDAVEFVTGRPSDEALPDIALVDLNLPGRDGCAVIEAIRAEPRLQRLPVIVLTSSEADEDVARCYDASANAYLAKPTDPSEFVSLAKEIERFWFEKASLPAGSA